MKGSGKEKWYAGVVETAKIGNLQIWIQTVLCRTEGGNVLLGGHSLVSVLLCTVCSATACIHFEGGEGGKKGGREGGEVRV